MRSLTKYLVFVLVFLGWTLSLTAHAEQGRDPYVHFFNQTLYDLPDELAMAKQQGKKGIFMFFELDDCPFCHYMKSTVLNQPEVQKFYRDNFINIPLDIEGDIEMVDFKGETMRQKDFAFKINRVRATPVLAFYDLSGERVVRHIGKTTGVEEFMQLGQYYLDGAYKTMPFARYKREQSQKQNNK